VRVASGAAPVPRFVLRRGEVVLEPEGVRHPLTSRGRGQAFTRYADFTHVALTPRYVWLASRRCLSVLPRDQFDAAAAPEALVRAILARVAELPGGAEQLARMAEVDRLGRRPARTPATWGLFLGCLATWGVQLAIEPKATLVASFSSRLFLHGDWWRPITASFLHGFPLHLVFNLVGVWVLGRLVERALGTARTVCLMMLAAIGAMVPTAWLEQANVVGASGVVLGLAGAVVWLELRWRHRLPAWWRFPSALRWVVIAALAADLVSGFFLPFIAASAHLGGFAMGLLAAAATTRDGPGAPAPVSGRLAAGALTAAVALAFGAAGLELARHEDYVAHHATRIGTLAGIPVEELNNVAWFIATAADATPAQLDAALVLARKAVSETGGRETTMLDTLAEVQFQLGREQEAVVTIDRAIAGEGDACHLRYYLEQRRRFTGERDPDDRPEDPVFCRPESEGPPLPPDETGLRV
jgi:membrane associated rhomboid family serine protease